MNDVFCDSHFHVGKFYNIEITPTKIIQVVNDLNISQIAISSLSACTEDFDKLKQEHATLESLLQGRALSILWLSPKFINSKGWEGIINSGINWRGLKIHGLQHNLNDKFYKKVVEIAKYHSFPIIIHTGGSSKTNAGFYKKIINKNKSLSFILAHGRPISEALDLLYRNDNVYVDTSFMPLENIILLIKSGFSNKIVFGSDYPAFKYFYPSVNEKEYIRSKILEIKLNSDESGFSNITSRNFQIIFNSNHY